ncbi:cytochrome C [bacterium CG_4_9_14_3_um_filter_65_15]|nr:MAG: cytochrome C [bacterium CG_4_9_14_3_um_filter_65_15]
MSEDRTDGPVVSAARRMPPAFYNTITFLGGGVAGVAVGMILLLLGWEYLSQTHSPYMGVIAFVVLPGIMILGLLVATFGVARQLRRRHLGLPATEKLPRVDLNNPAHLRATILIGIGTVVFLMATGFGSFQAYEYTESDEFCGTMCHTVMKPEYTAFQVSPHARVGCVKCHIGPGAEWFVRSKLSGAYQVYSVLFNKYSKPIETPIRNLRPSRDTCEQCHWPAHFLGEKMVQHDYFAPDEENTHWRLQLLMKTGGGGAGLTSPHGIHWHVAEDVTIRYVSTDERRMEIPWVSYTDGAGNVKIFRSTEADADSVALAGHEVRVMDCIDCHNRPTHHYNPPARLVNQALAANRISADLPDVKSLLVDLMTTEYETEGEALAAIDQGITAFYRKKHPVKAGIMVAEIAEASATAQELFKTNIFPEMHVDWRGFPDHIGHLTTPGCFRCHDGLHETEDGEVISHDCRLCHDIVSQEVKTGEVFESLAGVEYKHPEDIDEEWKTTNCSDCHGG